MAKYRKKPIVVEAEQFLLGRPWPPGVIRGWWRHRPPGIASSCCDCNDEGPHVHKQAGTLLVSVSVSHGDWIVKGSQGEYYPVKDHVFLETYEPVE